jgi:Methyltransferase domain
MDSNKNTAGYWNSRFGSGDWASAGGYSQTRLFADSQIPRFGLSSEFSGTLCDFGCGGGDAFPAYRAEFPKAHLVGVDFSAAAIRLASERFGALAEFRTGNVEAVPEADVIVVSNVMEHVTNDIEVAEKLRARCKVLHITVPYMEGPTRCAEHVRSYGLDAFERIGQRKVQIFASRGWSEFGLQLIWSVYLKNVGRTIIGRPRRRRSYQVMYSFGSLDR